MNEPTTTISTVDYTIGYSPDPPDNRLNILSPIIAPQGPVELTRVSGPSEFQRLYFGGRSVKSTDDFSAIFARGLVSNAPIWIKRGVRDNLKGGLSSSTGQEIFTDSELNLITGIKAKFGFNTGAGSSYVPYETAKAALVNPQTSNVYTAAVVEDHYDQLVFAEQPYDGSKIAITNDNKANYKINVKHEDTVIGDFDIALVSEDGTTFTLAGDPTPDLPVAADYAITFVVSPPLPQYTVTDKMIYSTSGLASIQTLIKTAGTESKVKTTLTLSGSSTNDVTITILNKQFRIPNHSTSLESLIQQLYDAKMFPQLISVDNAFSEPSFLTVSDGIVNFGNKGIRGIAWTSNFGIFISDENAGISVNHPDEEAQTTIYQAPLKSSYDYQESYPITDPKIDIISEEGVKYCFYAGNAIADGDVNTYFTGTQTFYSLLENLVKYGSDLLNADSSIGNSIVYPFCTSITYSDASTTESEIDTSLLTVSYESINNIIENDKFAVLAAFPCLSNAISCEIKESEQDEVYRLTVNYGTDSEVWDIAFDSGICNGYGESLYYTRVNEQSSYIRVVELDGPSVSYQTLQFGDEITSQYCSTKEIQAALEYMKENDEASVDFDYITDGGLVDNSLSKYILQLCEYYNSFYPVSVKTNSPLSIDYLKEFRASLGDVARARFIANTQRASILDNGSIEMPASYFYMVYRIDLGNTVREFIKVMEETNGDIGMQNPIQKFSRLTRESLLDNQIVTLKKGRNGAWYLNECLTLYKVDSYLQEDGTVLMVNKVNQLARAYADPLKGQDNTADLRSSVESELLRIINDRLRTGTKYGPINMRVVCNDSNNSTSLQNQRKLRIDIYATFSRSIKDVLIYSNVIPLT